MYGVWTYARLSSGENKALYAPAMFLIAALAAASYNRYNRKSLPNAIAY
jgi:hypothetical protein